tara:strand:+ start:381 stop:734 length:354 start_codon:yes stop_codon:yes gene_type:complete
MKKYYRGEYIRCTEEVMISAIKLFNLGANAFTICKYMGISTSRQLQFREMISQGKVYFLDNETVKCVNTRYNRPILVKSEDPSKVLIDEDFYGGPQGELPEFVVLWDDYQQTIKDYE